MKQLDPGCGLGILLPPAYLAGREKSDISGPGTARRLYSRLPEW